MDYPKFDLDHLKALDALLREKHVTRAAKVLNISQPAMSRVLAHLRSEFDDELLVRNENGLILTPRAEQLIEPIRRIIADAGALIRPPVFNPQDLTSEITLSGLDVEFRLFLPLLAAHLSQEAPNMKLRAIPFERGDFGILDSGEVDFLLTAAEGNADRFRRRLLYDNDHVVVMNNKLAEAIDHQLTLENFVEMDHGLVSYTVYGEGFVDTALKKKGLKRRVILRIPSFTLVPHLCAARDIIFTMPKRLINTFPQGLTTLPLPLKIDPIPTYVYWHTRNHDSPIHTWFRTLIYQSADDIRSGIDSA